MTGVSDTVIRVENLGKKYIIGHQQQGRSRYTALRDVLADGAKSVGRRILNPFAQQPPSPTKEEFWALKDVSFEIKQGTTTGIVGCNGAGKSTLLKLLSRITVPTSGRIAIKGRIASLLEVGTGFHPELTGRENIYLNGAVLGMSKVEIKKKFDEIVAFAEIEKFLDSPVKHYSSGMFVRLAFSIAAHLEPEILIIDEVLAVGDAAFQNKCLAKIRGLTERGITSLFVSHDMHLIELISKQCLYLEAGMAQYFEDVNEAMKLYFRKIQSLDAERETLHKETTSNQANTYEILALTAFSSSNSKKEVGANEDLVITLNYKLNPVCLEVYFNISIWSEHGLIVTSSDSRFDDSSSDTDLSAQGEVTCRFPSPALVPGKYYVRAYVISNIDWPLASFGWNDGRTCQFTVEPVSIRLVTGMNWSINQSDYGVVKLNHEWSY